MSEESTAEMQQDGQIVVGARCLDDDCDWMLGTDDPVRSWDLVERLRLDHEDDTGHQTTIEVVQQRTILAGKLDSMDLGEYLIDNIADSEIEWLCPDCEQTADELNASKRCPNCEEPFREVLR